MHAEAVFVLLFVVASTVAIAARWLRIPYTVALVLAGLLLGALNVLDPPVLTRELLFAVFLPGLLFEAAYHTEFKEFWRNRVSVTALAVPGVVASIALTAVIVVPVADALEFALGFAWVHGLLFGAVISATDPIAVVALFKNYRTPARLTTLAEGESLLNDGTSIVFFTLILGYVLGETMPAGSLAVRFVTVVGGGALVGLAIGLAVSETLKRLNDPMIEITLTTIAAYGSFIAAEHFAVSGVIATVAAGMVCGNYGARWGMSPSTRIAAETYWEYVAFALNSIVFLLIGFEVELERLLAAWQPILVGYVAIMVVRALVVGSMSGLLRRTVNRIPSSWAAVLTWGGLRGGLSMVLVLSVPASLPQRDFLVTLTFGVVVLVILVNGLTMTPLLRWVGLVQRHESRAAYERIRGEVQIATEALAEIDRMQRARVAHLGVLDELRQEYEGRIEKAESQISNLHLEQQELREEEILGARRRLLLAEKEHAVEAYRQGVVSRDAYDELIADIDARLLRLE